jgi:hypothetical protein
MEADMERITNKDIEARVENLNRRLTNGRQVVAQGRNGYIGLDEYDASGAMVRTFTCGSKREVADWLFAAMQGIDLANG